MDARLARSMRILCGRMAAPRLARAGFAGSRIAKRASVQTSRRLREMTASEQGQCSLSAADRCSRGHWITEVRAHRLRFNEAQWFIVHRFKAPRDTDAGNAAMPATQIVPADGLYTKVLEPIWTIKPETPSRVRDRIGIVTPGVGRVCRCRGLERTDSCFCVIVGASGGRRRNW
jgi:hypothetical protein